MKPCKKCGGTQRYTCGSCKSCAKARAAAWHNSNPEKKRAHGVAWRKNNPDKVKESNAAWYQTNPEKTKYQSAAWAKANPEKVKAAGVKWRRDNRDKYNARAAKKRASKLQATPVWANQFFIEEIYDLAHRRTKVTGFKWQVDHAVPLKSNLVCGLHVEHNLTVIPAKDNRIKSNTHWPDMP